MPKFLICFLTILSLGVTAQSQEEKAIDSLERKLEDMQESTTRVDILNNLAVQIYNLDTKQSLKYGDQALELAQKLSYDKGIQAAHSILRRVHRRLGNYTVALEYTLQNLPISEKLNDTLELLDSYMTLGNINSSMNNFEAALPYLYQALTIGKKIDSDQLSSILNFLGRAYGKIGEYDSAQHYIQAALLRELDRPQPGYGVSYIYNNLAEVYYYKKEYTKALEFYSLSTGLSDDKKSQYGLTFTYNGLANVYNAMGESGLAADYAFKSIEIAKQNLYRDKAKEAYGILSDIYQKKGDYKKAMEYSEQFNLYEDSIYSDDRLKYIENLKINYETERIQQENELLRKDTQLKEIQLSQQLTIVWVSVITIGLLIIITTLLFRINKQRDKTNKLLVEQSVQLEKQVEDRTQELVNTNIELVKQNIQLEQFGYIIAHNLRAPVARILGLTSIISAVGSPGKEDAQVVENLHTSATELDAIIHDLNSILETKQGSDSPYEVIDLEMKLEKVKKTLIEKIRDTEATIAQDFSQARNCYGIPAYVESIFYNLLSNALKYRSPDRKPLITVTSTKADQKICVRFEDNGIGIETSKFKDKIFSLYQRFHKHVEGKGMGLYLVKTQVEALNGTISIQSEVGKGTSFIITFPDTPVES